METLLRLPGDEATQLWGRRHGLPPARFGEAHLYAVQFDTGVIKVGFANNVRTQVWRHVSLAQVHGRTTLDLWISEPHYYAPENEAELIAYCDEAGTRLPGMKEYFSGVDMAQLIRFAEGLSIDRDACNLPARAA